MSVFRKEIQKIPEVAGCLKEGLGALGTHSKKIKDYEKSKIEGSIEIDDCVKHKYPNDNRWDYVLGYNKKAFFVEVHSAQTGEVSTMFAKLEWLKWWLNNRAPGLKKIKDSKTPFIWISSKNVDIPKFSPQYRQLVSAGLLPKSYFSLKHH